MINFVANAKEFRLNDGRVVVVKRKPMAYYYLLVASVIIYKNAMDVVSGINEKKRVSEYTGYMKEHSIDFAKVKVEYDNIKTALKEWCDIDTDKEEAKVVFEILAHVMDFNTLRLTQGGEGIQDMDKLNEQFESMVATLSLLLKKEPEYIYSNINNYQACVILHEANKNRVQTMNDLRYAQNANSDEYRKYTSKLLGIKSISGNEIFSNPNLLNEVH